MGEVSSDGEESCLDNDANDDDADDDDEVDAFAELDLVNQDNSVAILQPLKYLHIY